MLLEEWLDELHVHSVVHVWVELECGRLELLVSEAAVVQELGVLLVVVGQAGHLATFPVEVTHVGSPMQGHEEEEPVHEHAPLAHILELHWVSCLYHFSDIF